MKLALLGYGKMGKEIEKIAIEKGYQIVLIIDINNQDELTVSNLQKAEVAIDFSVPGTAYHNIIMCFEAGIPVVSGTTGWFDKFDDVLKKCKEQDKSFFYASNFSIGVNVFFQLNKYLAQMMDALDDYDVSIEEIHHTQKLDAPSGTAITLSNDIISELKRKNKWELGKASGKESIKIKAKRENNIPGTHIITYDSDIDFIKIEHSAKGRKGFALGAVIAAEYIQNKKGYFTMNDLLNL